MCDDGTRAGILTGACASASAGYADADDANGDGGLLKTLERAGAPSGGECSASVDPPDPDITPGCVRASGVEKELPRDGLVGVAGLANAPG